MIQILNLSLSKCSVEIFFIWGRISSKHFGPFWNYYLGRATEVHLPFKDEGPRDIRHDMSMVQDTRKSNFMSVQWFRFHIWFIIILYYKMQQILLKKCSSIFITKCDKSLLQNVSSYLLQNVIVLLPTVITKCVGFITKCDSHYKL